MGCSKQRTFYVDGQKMVVKSRPRTWLGCLDGFYVWVNGAKSWQPWLDRDQCEDRAYSNWVKKNVPEYQNNP